jgi:hypothetical protein
MTTLRAAWGKVSPRLLAMLWVGNAAAILLALAWLQIPDSHVWQVAISFLCAAAWSASVLWLYADAFRRASAEPRSGIARHVLVILIAIVVAWLLLQVFDAGRAKEGLFAGYWNSRFSAQGRVFFTYPRLVAWQRGFYDVLQWAVATVLLAMMFAAGVRRRFDGICRNIWYWVVAAIAGFLSVWVTGLLMDWTPGRSTKAQIVSVMSRLLVAYTLDIVLLCWVIAVAAAADERAVDVKP